MKSRTYFLVNDTRYDNHHGGLTVVRNLHAGMQARGWTCTGSLPVSASPRHLRRYRQAIGAAELVIVNGEGSLHHDSRNAQRLLGICNALEGTHPLALVNALWQQNDPAVWAPLLRKFRAVYTRDRRSQAELATIGVDAGFAPDMTFYAYPEFPNPSRTGYLCTDSVVAKWTKAALCACEQDDQISFMTLFTRSLPYRRGPKDWGRAIKYWLFPLLDQKLKVNVPPRYRSLSYAMNDTTTFMHRMATGRAVCAARYHALCFALQQNTPFLAVASNSHKSEALLEDAGIPAAPFMMAMDDVPRLRENLERAEKMHAGIAADVRRFRQSARERIDSMLDDVTG